MPRASIAPPAPSRAPGSLTQPPRVSVIVPAHNVERYIGATIESLRCQTYADFEIVFVDDASTDATVSIIEPCLSARALLVRHARNAGIAATRNSGLARARGEFIAFLDADDLAEPERLARQVAALDADPDLGMIGSHVAAIDEAGQALNQIWRRPVDPLEASIGLLYRNTFSCVTMLRRAAVPAGGFGNFTVCEDYDFNARVAQRWKVANLDAALTRVRVRRGGLTHAHRDINIQYRRAIMRAQLAQLALEPSERELDINSHVDSLELGVSATLLDEVEQWLLKLSAANRACGRFDPTAFDRVMAKEWFAICKFSAPLGFAAIAKYLRSGLAKAHRPTFPDGLKFLLKAVMRHRRDGSDYPSALYARLSRSSAGARPRQK